MTCSERGVEKHMEKLQAVVNILEPNFVIDGCDCGCSDCECSKRDLGASEGLGIAGKILEAIAQIDKKYDVL